MAMAKTVPQSISNHEVSIVNGSDGTKKRLYTEAYRPRKWLYALSALALVEMACFVILRLIPLQSYEDDGKHEHKSSHHEGDRSGFTSHVSYVKYIVGIIFLALCFFDAFMRAVVYGQNRVVHKQEERIIRSAKAKVGQSNGNSRRRASLEDFRMSELEHVNEFWYYLDIGLRSLIVLIFHLSLLPMPKMSANEYIPLVLLLDERSILLTTIVTILKSFKSFMISHTKRLTSRVVRNTTIFAVKHPKRFRRRVRKILDVVRWVKYLAPLIGTGNKLKGNIGDLIKKYQQHREAKIALGIRKLTRSKLKGEELLLHTTLQIQSAYRSRQARRAARVFAIMQSDKKRKTALLMQRVARTQIAKTRTNMKKKEHELGDLEKFVKEKEKHVSISKMILNPSDDENFIMIPERLMARLIILRVDLYEIERVKRLQKQLLRPNTTFALNWKIAFVVAVTIELLEKVLAGGGHASLEMYLHDLLVMPSVCTAPEESFLLYLKQIAYPKLGLFRKFSDPEYDAFLEYQYAVDTGMCDALSPAELFWATGISWLIQRFFIAIGIVCFLDVFVTFFTGELNAKNGCLIPKPFFPRWILPGMFLQLLVNPAMGDVMSFVSSIMKEIDSYYGPGRVLRWFFALSPVTMAIFDRLTENIMYQVEKANKLTVKHSSLL